MINNKIYFKGQAPRFLFNEDQPAFKAEQANLAVLTAIGYPSPQMFEDVLSPKGVNLAGNYLKDVEILEQIDILLRLDNIKLIVCFDRAAFAACALAGGGLLQDITKTDNPLREAQINGEKYLLPDTKLLMHPYNLPNDSYEVLAHSLEKSQDYFGVYAKEAKKNNYVQAEYVLFKNFEKPILAIPPNLNRLRINARTTTVTKELINNIIDDYNRL